MEYLLYLVFFLLIFIFVSFLILITIRYDIVNSISLLIKNKMNNNNIFKSKRICKKKQPVTKNKDLILPDNIQLIFRTREEDLKKMNSLVNLSNTTTSNSIVQSNLHLRNNPYVITKYKPCIKNHKKDKSKSSKTKTKNNSKNKLYDSMYYDKNEKLVQKQKQKQKWLPVKNSECLI